jgi:hypothetical protein
MAACHDGEDHPWPMWEMQIPYSPRVTGGYPMVGPITRYESLSECRAMRTSMIRSNEQWGSDQEFVRLLRGRTWCRPAWPDTVNWGRINSTSEGGVIWTMKKTTANETRLQQWSGAK